MLPETANVPAVNVDTLALAMLAFPAASDALEIEVFAESVPVVNPVLNRAEPATSNV